MNIAKQISSLPSGNAEEHLALVQAMNRLMTSISERDQKFTLRTHYMHAGTFYYNVKMIGRISRCVKNYQALHYAIMS